MQSELPTIDIDFGVSQLSGNRDVYKQLLSRYAEENRLINNTLGKLVAENETTQAWQKVHTLKGVSANIGLAAITWACKQLEQALRNNQQIGLQFDAFTTTMTATLQAIDNFVSSDSTEDKEVTTGKPRLLQLVQDNRFIPAHTLTELLAELACPPGIKHQLQEAIDSLDYATAQRLLSEL